MRDSIKTVYKWEKVKALNIGIYGNSLKFTTEKRDSGRKEMLLCCIFEIISKNN